MFNQDVVVDLIGYRKYGHNELDQPSFTQPIMYSQVAKTAPVARIYEKFLVDNKYFTQEQVDAKKKRIIDHLENAYSKSKSHEFEAINWKTEEWASILNTNMEEAEKSGVELSVLKDIGIKISTLPNEDFHRLIKKIFEQRVQTITKGEGIDWGTAEALAFATLINDGYNVRISGQDVERGTFSHRHAHVFYQEKDGYYNPINATFMKGEARRFIASNSHLSEFAVMGYELGYAQTHPNTLTMWEA